MVEEFGTTGFSQRNQDSTPRWNLIQTPPKGIYRNDYYPCRDQDSASISNAVSEFGSLIEQLWNSEHCSEDFILKGDFMPGTAPLVDDAIRINPNPYNDDNEGLGPHSSFSNLNALSYTTTNRNAFTSSKRCSRASLDEKWAFFNPLESGSETWKRGKPGPTVDLSEVMLISRPLQ